MPPIPSVGEVNGTDLDVCSTCVQILEANQGDQGSCRPPIGKDPRRTKPRTAPNSTRGG